MNKKMREILAKIQEKTVQAKAFMEGENKDVEKANALLDEIDALQKEYEAEERLYKAEKMAGSQAAITPVEPKGQEPTKVDPMIKFAQDARAGFRQSKSMNEGTAADGGYTVPEDIQTKINTYKESKVSLLGLVSTENVKTDKGSRTFKKRSQQTGFTKVGEGGKIGAKATPQFEKMSYEIGKYAGYFPVTNELLADSDANIANTLITWIGDESRVTANKLILAAIALTGSAEFKDLDDVKKALNVTLGSAFKATSNIVTNDNGLQYLDTLKDSTGRYLLAPMPGDTMRMGLQVGAATIPVVVIPNGDMPNGNYYVASTATSVAEETDYYTKDAKGVFTKVESPSGSPKALGYFEVSKTKEAVPFIVGDLKEAIQYFDRQHMNIKVSDIAQIGDLNAFEEDLTLYRAIEREDVQVRDDKAVVNGFIGIDK